MTQKINKYKLFYPVYGALLLIFTITRAFRNSFGYNNPREGGIWNVIGILFMVLSFIFFVVDLWKRKTFPLPIFILMLYSGFAQVHSLFHFDFSKITLLYLYNFVIIAFSPAILFLFYKLGGQKITKAGKIITLGGFFLLSALTSAGLLLYKFKVLDYVMISNSYYGLCLLPLVLYMCDNKYWRIGAIATALFVVVISEKRAGLFAALGFILVLFIFRLIQAHGGKKLFKTVLWTLIAIGSIILGYIFFAKIFDLTLFEQVLNMFKDGGSSRTRLYKTVLEAMAKSSPLEWIFGHGMESATDLLGGNVHDDFLEILYNHGIVPLLLVVSFYISLLITGFKMAKNRYPYAPDFLGSVCICGCMSLLSVFLIDYNYVTGSMASLGFALGQYNLYKKAGAIPGENVTNEPALKKTKAKKSVKTEELPETAKESAEESASDTQ